MNKYRFKTADYKRISKYIFLMSVAVIPILLFSVYFLDGYSSLPYIISGLIGLGLLISIYLTLLKYFLVYDSEIIVDEKGIKEKNLKIDKEFVFNWEEVESFKSGEAKHINEDKEYLTITFRNSMHTISVSEYKDNHAKMKIFNEFRDLLTKYIKI